MTELTIGGIGHFMLAVGAVIEHLPSGKILIVQRSGVDYQVGEWEIVYGRLDHHEEAITGLHREVSEELGITNLEIKKMISVFHFYRGEKTAETEIYGMTFHGTVDSDVVTLNDEHSTYEWVTPEEALQRITVSGIQKDIKIFIEYKKNPNYKIAFSTDTEEITYI